MVDGWINKSFKEISSKEPFSIGDGDHGLITEKDYVEDGIPLIRIVDIDKNGKLNLEKIKRISKEAHNRVKKSWLKPRDVLVSKTGTLGRSCIIPEFIKTANTTSSIAKITLNNKIMDINYFHQFILSPFFNKQLEPFYSKTAQPGFNNSEFEKFICFFPKSILEQKKIAEILTKVDEAIFRTEEIISKNERIKKGLMQDLFTKGIDEKGNFNIIDFKELRIPENWFVGTMKDICNVKQGLQIPIAKRKKEEGSNRLKYITIQYLNNPKINKEYIENPINTVICNKDDILFTRTGNTGQIITGIKGVFHNNFFKIIYNKKLIDKKYLIYFLNLEYIQNLIKDLAGTTTISDLNHGDFFSIPIFFPKSLIEQKKIASILSKIDEKIEKEKEQLNKLKRIKKGLMKDLLSGRVRVNHLINEEVTA
jgi:type I restriction enzyme S subunit